MQYRSEVDGLRAVAVLPVILFHAGFALFSGGYAGVDVFFVISGFLITNIILGEIESGAYSIARFYERRARRILPALFAVLASTLPFAYLWLSPAQFTDYTRSLAATALFLSNFHFLGSADYFAPATDQLPLLHTWSLAVEEQFYVVFPLILSGLTWLGRMPRLTILILIGAASMVMAEWGVRNEPDANFYFTLSRFWELIAGALCAVVLNKGVARGNQLLSATGLGLILFAMFGFDGNTPFPSLYTLVPVGGTAMVILFASRDTLVGRLLSLRLVVWIGLISYSAYLWHQPLLAFARVKTLGSPPTVLLLSLVLTSLVLAALTWRFVEQPFRRRDGGLKLTRRRVFLAGALGSVVFLVIGVVGEVTEGLPGRFTPEILRILAVEDDRNPLGRRCIMFDGDAFPAHPVAGCDQFLEEGKAQVLFIGDSHGDAITYQAQTALRDAGISSYGYTYSGCIAFRGLAYADPRKTPDCDGYTREMLAFARAEGITTLVIASRFTLYAEGTRFDNGEGGLEHGRERGMELIEQVTETGPASAQAATDTRRDRVLATYAAELEAFTQEFNVVLVYPIPEAGWDVPRYVAQHAVSTGGPLELGTLYSRYVERNGAVETLFDGLELDRLYRVRPAELLCNTILLERCAITRDGMPLYFDDDHLANETGAKMLAPLILEQVQAALAADDG